MKLVHSNISRHIDFEKTEIYQLVIENANEFYKLTKEIISQCNGENGEWVLSETFPIELNKNVLIMYNFYDLSCNNKKTENLLKTQILKLANEVDFVETLSNINKALIEFNDLIVENIDFNLETKSEYSVEELLKFIKYSFSEEENLLEKIVSYINVHSKLSKIKLVIFIGLSAYLNEEEIKNLTKDIVYKDLRVLFIESKERQKLEDEIKIIIDKDLCEI